MKHHPPKKKNMFTKKEDRSSIMGCPCANPPGRGKHRAIPRDPSTMRPISSKEEYVTKTEKKKETVFLYEETVQNYQYDKKKYPTRLSGFISSDMDLRLKR